VIVVCANKSDMKKQRKVTEQEGRAWAKQHKLPYFETSARSGAKVNDMFRLCTVSVYGGCRVC
jgi:hypothetical protein